MNMNVRGSDARDEKQGNNKEAMEDYGRAIELDGDNPKAFNNRGALALKMGK